MVQLVSLHHCPHINCITTLLHAQRTVANFAACQHHKITILHILRVTALLHYCITALRPSRCCVVAVGITASLCYCRCNYYIGTISVTASLLAQRTVANFAACQHHRITIFHVLRVTALLHYCITASQGHRLLHYYVTANVYCVTALCISKGSITALLLPSRFHSRAAGAYPRDGARAGSGGIWVGLGCGNGVGFVVKCIGIHIESPVSTNPSHSIQNTTPKTHPYQVIHSNLLYLPGARRILQQKASKTMGNHAF